MPGFVNTFEGASEEDVLGFADHLRTHFPGYIENALKAAISMHVRFRPQVIEHTTRGTIHELLEIHQDQKLQSRNVHVPRTVTKEFAIKHAVAKTEAFGKRHDWRALATKRERGEDPEVLRLGALKKSLGGNLLDFDYEMEEKEAA